MLDKQVPYAEIWMVRSIDTEVPSVLLADGYHFEYYQPGDESDWVRIECAVGEFENEKEGHIYFQRSFAPYPEELKKRMLFVVNDLGEKVGTCTAWFKERFDGTYPLFHWLAVVPEHQGKGLAKALTVEILTLFQKAELQRPIYLHTQTWSHPAIKLYQKLGFSLLSENFDGSENSDYPLAMEVLKRLEKEKGWKKNVISRSEKKMQENYFSTFLIISAVFFFE